MSEKGGRRNENMSSSEEDAFIKPFLESAKEGGILEVGRIHRAYEKELGREVKKSVVYLLLHRHNWRRLPPAQLILKRTKKRRILLKKLAINPRRSAKEGGISR